MIFAVPLKRGVLGVRDSSAMIFAVPFKSSVLGVPDSLEMKFCYALKMGCTECTRFSSNDFCCAF